ncbi:MAG: LUD domain-containing protein [Halolamina sp.]
MSTRREKAEHIRHLLETEGESVRENTTTFNESRYEALDGFEEYEDLRDEARLIKEDAIERIPELVETVTDAVEANGGHVYLADDAADANAYIEGVCEDENAETLVKSKSMTTEEIEVNESLAEHGVDVYETDLGEFVIQVAGEAPSHLVGPGIHKSREEIAALFNEQFEPEEPLETAEELTQFARDYLGEHIREADVGMTGANFIAAESGTIALVTNEGNARKSAVTPDTHVAVAGVEKLIPSLRELAPMVDLIAKSATGQDIAQYVSLFSPPTDSPTVDFQEDSDVPLSEQDGERDFHLVLIDNGRMEMREDEDLRETLYCIRCGACSNSCANFQHVGGHAFGGETYTGGIATGWEAGIEGGASASTDPGSISPESVEFNDLCTGCSRCVNACPVKIDIPWINTVVRDRINRSAEPDGIDTLVDGLVPDEESPGMDPSKRVFGNIGTLAKLGSATAPVSNWLADSRPVRAAMDRWLGIHSDRELPTFQRETFRDWFEQRTPTVETYVPESAPARDAVLFPDTYTNYIDVERGKAAVRTLEALGVDVRLAGVTESGRAPLSQGMVTTAEARARDAADALEPHIEDGWDIVVVEPSDAAMFRGDYEKLLDADRAERIAEHSYDVMEYLYGLLENGAELSALQYGATGVTYHSHCQQRTLGLEVYTETVLERLGYDVATTDAECCGMAGSFGYKSEYYDLSTAVGDSLVEEVRELDSVEQETTAPSSAQRKVVASGTSCLDQLEDLLDRPSTHPIELVAPDPNR